MKKLLLFFMFHAAFMEVNAQAFQWAKSIGGGVYSDYGKCILADNTGNVYIGGHFEDIVNFMGNFLQSANGGAFLLKLDPSGSFISVFQFGGPTAIALCLKRDAAGNMFVGGTFTAAADFDPGPGVVTLTPAGNRDIFLMKLNSGGTLQWARSFSSSSEMDLSALVLDSNNNVITTGFFKGMADFDPGIGVNNHTAAGVDIFISKLNAAGNFVWAHHIGDASNDFSYALALDNSGNIFTTGSFRDTTDFDPGPGISNLIAIGAGVPELFILKLDNAGNFVWAKQMGGINTQTGRAIAIDANNNLYLSGEFYFSSDFDPGPAVYNLNAIGNGNENIFVAKLDPNGNFLWAKQIDAEMVGAMMLDHTGNVYTVGSFKDTVDFDPGPAVYNMYSNQNVFTEDMYISKLSASGNFLLAQQITGDELELANAIFVDSSNNVYTTGYFTWEADFDPGPAVYNLFPVAISSLDIFIAKYNFCSPASTFTIIDTACGSYTLNGQTYGASGTYTQILPNAIGCDSVITLNLTINPINNGVNQVGGAMTAIATGAVYQWLTCNPYQIIPGETAQTFNALANGDYAVIVTQNGCTDTSACYPFIIGSSSSSDGDPVISLYPNPVSERLYIRYTREPQKGFILEVSDLCGRTVRRTKLPGNSKQVSVSVQGLESGVYHYKVWDGEMRMATGKILVR